MTELDKAKKLLQSRAYTCVLVKDEMFHSSMERGVKPLVQWLHSGERFEGFYAADKVVGKGAAFLYVKLKVKAVYASVMSEPARQVLDEHGIHAEYDTLAEHIINRKGDGLCPFEKAVLDINDPEIAYGVILKKLQEMRLV